MNGWALVLTVLAVVAVLVALAWWSSGRAGAGRDRSRPMSEVEKDDAMRQNQRRQQGAGGGLFG